MTPYGNAFRRVKVGARGARTARRRRCAVLGTRLDALGWRDALERIVAWCQRHESRAVYHVSIRGIVYAARDAGFRDVLNTADLATPAAAVLAWRLRWKGFPAQRLDAIELMWRYCARAARLGHKIYLYGGSRDTLQRLWQRLASTFPGIRIVGACAPPRRESTLAECEEVAARINQAGANAVLVALGCPDQERWIARQRGAIQAVMFGVGDAFEHYASDAKPASRWRRRWTHDPIRLWRRCFSGGRRFAARMRWQFIDMGRRHRPHG